MRRLILLAPALLLAGCVAPRQAPPPRPAPTPPPPQPALPAAPPQEDWRDVPLTPGTWAWHGAPGQASIAQFLVPGQQATFAMRCDFATRTVRFSRAGSVTAQAAAMKITSSFSAFTLPAANGGGQPSAIVAQTSARDPHLDQMAFSRGRFTVDIAGLPQLVLPAWPETARVIEDCRK
jgi:hypothetical protein